MNSYLWWTFNGECLKSWENEFVSYRLLFMWRWLCLFFSGFTFKRHLLPKNVLKKRLEGEVLHRAGCQVITSLIAHASCSYFDPKKKNPLQREQFTLIWSKCRRQLLYSIITSLTSHLDSSKLEVFTCSRPSFCLHFLFDHGPSLSLSLSLSLSCCLLLFVWHK